MSFETGTDPTQATADHPHSEDDIVVRVNGLSKHYPIYNSPRDRLKQFIYPRLQHLLGRPQGCYHTSFRALDGISFDVRKGETLGIVGRNGSGKSTLLQIICGTLTPTAGSMTSHGRIAALLELGAGFDPEFTGRDNIYMNAMLLGLTRSETDARMDDILAFADIGDFVDQPVKTYSSGMFVRLAFAIIAHVDADILVIDEALAVGDAFFVQKCMRFLRQFMKTGTVIFVSHDTNAVLNLCQRAIWLDKGRIIAQGSPKKIASAYLKAFYEDQQGDSDLSELDIELDLTDDTPEEATDVSLAASRPILINVARDMRQDVINHSAWRNDLEVFEFDPDAEGFGKGGALFEKIELLDTENRPLTWIVGGEEVILHLQAGVQPGHALERPIVGFYIKDRLGQVLFGDNTYLSYQDNPVATPAGSHLHAWFRFRMPVLTPGDYTVSAAIADGTQHEHVQHQWLYDALHFKSHAASHSHGLIGLPMHEIRLQRQDAQV